MTSSLPLEGMKVLDFSQIMAGPYCTMLLADMGADVIKIEKPNGGDDTRRMGPPFVNGEAAGFLGINRNKRSVILDLKNERGVETARNMAKTSDVLIENFRPGTLERLGLGYDAIHALNSSLIYCTISGFGITGPYKTRGGFDLVAQGMSGIMSITGFPGSPPVKPGVPIADLTAGMYAAYGILTAYVNRLKTGKGQRIDTSLLEAGIAYTLWESMIYFTTGEIPKPAGSAHRLTAPYQAFRTSDGYINIGAANQANWERMCRAIDRDDLLEDPRFTANADRMPNLEALQETLEDTFSKKPTNHWMTKLEEVGVPSGPIYDMRQVYEDPQVRARDMVVETDHPTAGRIKNIGLPVKFSETPGSIRRSAPTLGQHTDEVLAEFGYSPEHIERLHEDGAVT